MDLHHPLIERARVWASADQPPSAEASVYCDSRDVFSARLERLRQNHRSRGHDSQADLVNAVIAEIGGNAFDHNLGQWRDVPGVYMTDSLLDGSGIVIVADRGQGLRTTIQRAV